MKDQMLRRVLVATALSERSPALIAAADDIAGQFGAELIVLHVFDPEGYTKILGETGMPIDQYIGCLRAELCDHVEAAGVGAAVRLEVVEGRDIASAIITAGARMHADLIVIGTRPRQGFHRVLLGGVADDVLRRARTPVLVVPPTVLEAIPSVAIAS